MVTAVDRGRFTCQLIESPGPPVAAVRGGDLRRTSVVVGDRVDLVGDVGGTAGTLARMVRVAPRTSLLRRTPDDTDPVERPVVANAGLLAIVCALADPPPRPDLVDRCLVAAFDGGLRAALLLTKSDLPGAGRGAAALAERYQGLDLPVLAAGRADPAEPVLDLLRADTSVLFGSSGVGKSTLVNRLVPGAQRATAVVGDTGQGRHTTSAAVMLPLAGGGWVVDTPGVRSFGLGLVDPDRVLAAFPDLAGLVERCDPGCLHRDADCALADPPPGQLARARSLRRLLAAAAAVDHPNRG